MKKARPPKRITVRKILDRLERVPIRSRLDVDQWAALCHTLLPELFVGRPRPAAPVRLAPGSDRKIAAMAARVYHRRQPHHPADTVNKVHRD